VSALLNPRVWIALALAAALALAGLFLYRAGRAAVQVDWNAQKAVDAEARILADRAREARTAARQAAIDEESRHGQEQIAALETELVDVRSDGEWLRSAIRAAAGRARNLPGAPAAGAGQPGGDAIGVFADLLERADRRAEAVAGYADRLRIAGSVCERSWDAGLRAAAGQPATGAVSGPAQK